ncbi:MAG: 50S ribosomal protein L25 [Candidatus Pacebacteria bacterium]|nr:50S ribosomal protein L25 [Candidatus Paceibacterota bacterium]
MVSLTAIIRDKKIKKDALRKSGFLPGVLYGEGIKNVSVQVAKKDIEKTLIEAGETSIVGLEIDGTKTDVLIHQIAKDPVTGKIIHIDFFHPSSKKKIEAEIELVFEGESEAVKSGGGILIKELKEIKVKGLAKDLPKELIVDVSVLKTLEDRVLVKDLPLPLGIEVFGHHDEDIVVHVALPKEEKEITAPEEPVEGEGEVAIEDKDGKDEEKKEKEQK